MERTVGLSELVRYENSMHTVSDISSRFLITCPLTYWIQNVVDARVNSVADVVRNLRNASVKAVKCQQHWKKLSNVFWQ